MRLGERATGILTHDLDLTGFFALIETGFGGKSRPGGVGKTPPAEDFRSWGNLGAEALIMGQVTFRDRSLTLEARLYDVVKKEMIVGSGISVRSAIFPVWCTALRTKSSWPDRRTGLLPNQNRLRLQRPGK